MRCLPLIALTAALVLASAAEAADAIEPQALVARLAWGDQSLVVLDVRTAAEYAEGHVPGARNIPHTEIAARIAELEDARGRDLVVYCRSGNRTAQALGMLEAAGFRRLLHLKGDYQRWMEAGRPVAFSTPQ
jgi:rhodanese-related sulfurtransferase